MRGFRRTRLFALALWAALGQIMADIRGMPKGYYVVMVGLVMVGNIVTVLVSK